MGSMRRERGGFHLWVCMKGEYDDVVQNCVFYVAIYHPLLPSPRCVLLYTSIHTRTHTRALLSVPYRHTQNPIWVSESGFALRSVSFWGCVCVSLGPLCCFQSSCGAMARSQEVPRALKNFDDVDDSLPNLTADARTGTVHMQPREITELLLRGNGAFRNGAYEEAIKEYSNAYKLQPVDPALLLSNRSAAFCKLSQELRQIPASFSEERALIGLDPMSHAELALKDVEKVIKMHSMWPKAHYRKGRTLTLLEQYDEARDAIFAGLQIDPSCIPLQVALQELNVEIEKDQLQGINNAANKRKRAKVQRTDDFDCTLCLKLLYNPITTPCGHSFCRACLLQAMDHGNKCPMCRTVLFVGSKTYPPSVTLKSIIQKNFPEEYAERKEEMDTITLAENEVLALFVMDVVLPCEKMSLNIFEPRYRLMVRRIMEGNRRMGMVGIDPRTGTVADVACEVEITECEPLPDGRFYLEIEGRRRCRLIKTWEQDGYRVGQVTWLEDTIPSNESSRVELQNLARSTADLARTCIAQAQETNLSERRTRLVDMLSQAEGMLNRCDPEQFSFWVANLLQLRPTERLDLLRLTDTRQRLIQELLFLRAGNSQGCHIQ